MVTRELRLMAVSDLIPYANNPRNNDGGVDAVLSSIEQCGYCEPICVDEDFVILAGHTRLKAIIKLGWSEVEVIVCTGMSDEMKRKYRILDNYTNELSAWNYEELAVEVEGLDFGPLQDGITEMLPDSEENEALAGDDDFEEALPAEPETHPGDIYQLGRHRLMCGDSTKDEDVQALMGDAQADLLLTDPPYGVAYVGGTADAMTIENDNLEDGAFLDFLFGAFHAADSVMRPGAAYYIWHADSRGEIFRLACKKIGWKIHECLIWEKDRLVIGRCDYQYKHEPCLYGWKGGASHNWFSDRSQTTTVHFGQNTQRPPLSEEDKDACLLAIVPLADYEKVPHTEGTLPVVVSCNDNEQYVLELDARYADVVAQRFKQETGRPMTIRSSVLEFEKPKANKEHPTMKPVPLFDYQIRNSTRKGENVLDLFGGSGTTIVACEQDGRNAYVMEFDPKYADVIVHRWESLTGQKAVLIRSGDAQLPADD